MKKSLLVEASFIILMLVIAPIASAGEPPTGCTNGYYIIGPPIVATLVVNYVSGEGPYELKGTFRGCCAQCFDDCRAFNVKFEVPFDNSPYLPEQYTEGSLQYLNVGAWGPKNCNPENESGEPIVTLIIETILKFDNTRDIDGDGWKELVADVVMYYWDCK